MLANAKYCEHKHMLPLLVVLLESNTSSRKSDLTALERRARTLHWWTEKQLLISYRCERPRIRRICGSGDVRADCASTVYATMVGSFEDWLENLWAFQQVAWMTVRASTCKHFALRKQVHIRRICEGVKSTMNASDVARWTIAFFGESFLLSRCDVLLVAFLVLEIHRTILYTSGEIIYK